VNIKIRNAIEDDLLDTWSWYADLTTRQMSGNTDSIDLEKHKSWFYESIKSPERFLFIGVDHNDNSIGLSRFDLLDLDLVSVSITLNPEMRGKKLSSLFLQESINEFSLNNVNKFIATIRKENISSIRCFEKVGFSFSHKDNEFNYYELILDGR